MDLLNKATDLFKGVDKPAGLDKAKAERDEISEGITDKNFEFAYGKVSGGLEKDMDELEIKDPAKRQAVREELKLAVQKEMVNRGALDAFLKKPGTLSAEIESKQGFLEKIREAGMGGGLATLILMWSESSKDEKTGKKTMFGMLLEKVAGWLSGEKKDEKKEAKEAEKTLADSLVKKFSDKGLVLEAASAAAGIADLAKDDIKDDELTKLVDTALDANGLLIKLYGAIKPKESLDQKFKFKLTDLRLQKNFSEERVGILVSALKNDKDSPYQVGEGLEGARKLLDAALTMKDGKLNEALATFKKPEKVPEKPAA